MGILKDLKLLYFSKGALPFHITAFSLTGLLLLCFNNVYSVAAENYFLWRITYIHLSKLGLYANFLAGGMLFVLLFGYEYKLVNSLINSEDFVLPKIDNYSYPVFLKMLPVVVLWSVYYAIAIVGSYVLMANDSDSALKYIPMAFLACCFPFLRLSLIDFAEEFKFSKLYANPFYLLKIIDRYFMRVFVYLIKFSVFLVPFLFLFRGLFALAQKYQSADIQLILLCISAYILYIINLIYSMGMANIVKETKDVHQ